jgi:hypothetical protein
VASRKRYHFGAGGARVLTDGKGTRCSRAFMVCRRFTWFLLVGRRIGLRPNVLVPIGVRW